MMIILKCNQCNRDSYPIGSGGFAVQLQFRATTNCCETCCNEKYDILPWSYNFCNLDCFLKWFKENNIEQEGFPCRDCHDWSTGKPTGFAFGHEGNGVCDTCKGTKRVKVTVPKGYVGKEEPEDLKKIVIVPQGD